MASTEICQGQVGRSEKVSFRTVADIRPASSTHLDPRILPDVPTTRPNLFDERSRRRKRGHVDERSKIYVINLLLFRHHHYLVDPTFKRIQGNHLLEVDSRWITPDFTPKPPRTRYPYPKDLLTRLSDPRSTYSSYHLQEIPFSEPSLVYRYPASTCPK
jgi:hypothetical protein